MVWHLSLQFINHFNNTVVAILPMQVMPPGDFRSFLNEFKNNNITKLDLTQTNRVVLAAND